MNDFKSFLLDTIFKSVLISLFMLIGIGGPSGSGKTTLAKLIANKIGNDGILILPMDRYYKDLSNIPMSRRFNRNFDTPTAFEVLFQF